MPRSRGHHFSLPEFHIDHNRNLKLMYALRVCRDLLSKFTLFFLPIFFYQLGSGTGLLEFIPVSDFQRGLLTIGLYYLIGCAVSAVSSIWAGRLTAKQGYQKSFIFSYFFYFILFVLLFYLNAFPYFGLFVLAAFIHGLQTPFFWSSYFTILSKNTKRAHMGQDLGVLQLLLQIVAVIAPALSGLIAYLLGMEVLFLIGIVVVLISVIFALYMEPESVNYRVSWQEFWAWLHERRYERLAVSMAGKYIYDAMIYIWPLYVFLLLGTVDKVGYLYTISLFLAMLVTFFAGVYLDKTKNKKPFYISGGVLSFIWLLRTQIVTVWGIVLSDTVDRLAANVHKLFFDAAIIKRSQGSKAFAYFIYREVIINVAATGFWTLFIIFFLFNGGWAGAFVFASAGAMVSLLVRDTKELKEPL